MVNCIYICSPGHSGSTLLDLLLGSHSRVESLGEISHLSKNLALNTECTCGKPVRSCPVWQEVLRIMGKRIGADLLTSPYALKIGYPRATVVVDKAHQTPAYLFHRKLMLGFVYLEQRHGINFLPALIKPFQQSLDINLLLFDVVRQVLGTDMVVDSSKSYLKAVGLYRKRPAKVRLILLTRDGRGVLYSAIKRNYSRRASVRGWKNYYARSSPLFTRNVARGHILHVRYEDLAVNPRKELSRICKFLGLQFEESMLDYSSHTHHITNGNDMRFTQTPTITLDASWQRKLSDYDRRYFELRAGQFNRSFGYE